MEQKFLAYPLVTTLKAIKLLAKIISVTKNRNQQNLKQLLIKVFLQIARKKFVFQFLNSHLIFAFHIVLLLLYTLYHFC